MRMGASMRDGATAPNPTHPTRTGVEHSILSSTPRACVDHSRPAAAPRTRARSPRHRHGRAHTRICGDGHHTAAPVETRDRPSAAEIGFGPGKPPNLRRFSTANKGFHVAALHRSKRSRYAPAVLRMNADRRQDFRSYCAGCDTDFLRARCQSSSPSPSSIPSGWSCRMRLPSKGSPPERRSSWRTSSASSASAAASAPAP